jgi:ribosomal protein S18 acetylase RimI-like enzyme
MQVIRANIDHAPQIGHLFNLYRQFYQCEADLDLAIRYITERIKHAESTIFIAIDRGTVVGFVQMYPTFCSVQAVKRFVLYDLFVDDRNRKCGTGTELMNRAAEHAKQQGAARLDLQTAFSNQVGQHLYEKLGYQKVTEAFYDYSLQL